MGDYPDLTGAQSFHVECTGNGIPTVMMEADVGGTLWMLDWLVQFVSNTTQVCVYSRAGYGYSSAPVSRTRTATQAAVELKYLVQAMDVDEFVLVGHGHGASVVRAFHARWEPQIVGLVFIDGRNPTCEAAACSPSINGDNSAARAVQSFIATGIPRVLGALWNDPLGVNQKIPELDPSAGNPLYAFLLTPQFWQSVSDEQLYLPTSCDQISRLAVGHRFTDAEKAAFLANLNSRVLDNCQNRRRVLAGDDHGGGDDGDDDDAGRKLDSCCRRALNGELTSRALGDCFWGYTEQQYDALKAAHEEFIPTPVGDLGARHSHDTNEPIVIPVLSVVPQNGLYSADPAQAALCGAELAAMTSRDGKVVYVPNADHLDIVTNQANARVVANEIITLINRIRVRLNANDLDGHHKFAGPSVTNTDIQAPGNGDD